MKHLQFMRETMSLVLGLTSLYLFVTHNVADAIYLLVMAVWIDPKGEKYEVT